ILRARHARSLHETRVSRRARSNPQHDRYGEAEERKIQVNAAWVSALGWTLIHFLWQGAAIAGIYSLARAFTAKPRTRYLLACAALLLMAIAPVVTLLHTSTPGAAPVHHNAPPAARSEWSTAPAVPAASEASLPVTVMPWIVMLWFAGAGALSLRLLLESLFATRLKSALAWPVSPN